jgi:hypothetical protein
VAGDSSYLGSPQDYREMRRVPAITKETGQSYLRSSVSRPQENIAPGALCSPDHRRGDHWGEFERSLLARVALTRT